jgi:hypothetical protein
MYYLHKMGQQEAISQDVDGTLFWIPKDESNRDYQAFLQWVSEGNEPTTVGGEST